ncbi:cytochrome P450 [Euzebya tangerina]|uniref:cytochrome P450 n=1 Tax=Euzebya tangerina TaxID=591198 RepID=UPI000E310E00|nr:cytochrome P450 [Euzebya tangerina]
MSATHAVDLLSPEATADPYTALAELRESDPVHYSDRHKAWIITRYDDVVSAMMDSRLSSARVGPVLERMRAEGADAHATEMLEVLNSWMVVQDPPEHTRLRKLAAGAFKSQRISAMEEQVAEMVAGYLDAFVASGKTDLVQHVAYPLPASIIAMLLGAPVEDRDTFGEWSDELALVAFGAGGSAREDRHERALKGVREMFAYLRTLLERVRETPGEDMISALIAPVEDGDSLTDHEVLSMCAMLLFAGHETTTNSTANGILALLRDPEQLALLRDDPDQIAVAVEELLRFDGPIKVLQRHVTETHEVAGHELAQGDRVFIALAAANRDPEKFDEPDRLDITRYPNKHVAFGRGIHACIGAQLARLEMRVNVQGILERLDGLRLEEGTELQWAPSIASRSLTRLPVLHDAV